MNNPAGERVEHLEHLFTHLEHTVQTLNQVIIDQQRRLDVMEQTLARLAFDLNQPGPTKDESPPLDEKPPHY